MSIDKKDCRDGLIIPDGLTIGEVHRFKIVDLDSIPKAKGFVRSADAGIVVIDFGDKDDRDDH